MTIFKCEKHLDCYMCPMYKLIPSWGEFICCLPREEEPIGPEAQKVIDYLIALQTTNEEGD